jgi:PLP dependent protein
MNGKDQLRECDSAANLRERDSPANISPLGERYLAVKTAINAASGSRADVQLLAVSKTFSAADVLALAALGQRAFGENYLQEALGKIAAVALERPDLPLEWHFIGPLQSNKTRPVAESFDWVHSVDRLKIAERLSAQRPAARGPLNLCLQVNVSGEASKSGCEPSQASVLAGAIAALPHLRLRGLMAIPEPSDDPLLQRERFASLRRLFNQLNDAGLNLDTLSMGMSADLAVAISEGATMVRVGSAIFGGRAAKPAATRTNAY